MAMTDHLMINCDETHLEKMRMALAEAGYGHVWLELMTVPRTGRTSLYYREHELPSEVAWQAYQVAGVPSSCLACFKADTKNLCETATAVWDRDCGRADR